MEFATVCHVAAMHAAGSGESDGRAVGVTCGVGVDVEGVVADDDGMAVTLPLGVPVCEDEVVGVRDGVPKVDDIGVDVTALLGLML